MKSKLIVLSEQIDVLMNHEMHISGKTRTHRISKVKLMHLNTVCLLLALLRRNYVKLILSTEISCNFNIILNIASVLNLQYPRSDIAYFLCTASG